MAEFVSRRMECKIPYLELLALTELFTIQELKPIIQDLSSHEYRVQKKERTLEDILQYAQAHINLLAEIRKRREERNYFHKSNEIEEAIKSEISSMLASNFARFCNRLDYWSTRINFSKAQGWNSAVRKHFEQATKILGKQYPQLWIEASNFEWCLRPTHIHIARKILQLGLRDNKNCEALYVAAFKLEIDYVKYLEEHPNQMKKVLETENGDLIANKLVLAKLIYEAAQKHCKPSTNFHLKFYLILQDMHTSKTEELIAHITRDAENSSSSLNIQAGKLDPLEEIENSLLMQFQNFSLFFKNYDQVLKALKPARDISKPEFWLNLFHLLHLKGLKLKMQQWFELTCLPSKKQVVIQLRLWVLNFYNLSYSPTGITKAREWYEKVHDMIPSFPEIYLRMAEIERNEATINHENIRKCYNRAILKHGKDSLEIWLAYINFEKVFFPRGNQYAALFSRALTDLNPSLVEHFKIAMLKN